jgi:hypothetical protein
VILNRESPFELLVMCICKRQMPTFPCVSNCHDVEELKILRHFTQIFYCCNLFLDCSSSYLHPFVLANFHMILLGFLDLSSSYLLFVHVSLHLSSSSSFVHMILLDYLHVSSHLLMNKYANFEKPLLNFMNMLL